MFYDIDKFPELKEVQKHWKEIRDEILACKNEFYPFGINNPKDSWFNLPLKPILADVQNLNMQKLIYSLRDACPKTREICKEVDPDGYMFISLKGNGYVSPHMDNTNHVTAMLGLDLEDYNIIRCENDYKKINKGEFIIFDYTKEHESWNLSNKDRLVLVLAMENKYRSQDEWLNKINRGRK